MFLLDETQREEKLHEKTKSIPPLLVRMTRYFLENNNSLYREFLTMRTQVMSNPERIVQFKLTNRRFPQGLETVEPTVLIDTSITIDKQREGVQFATMNDAFNLPMRYPLLFAYGEMFWGAFVKEVTGLDYLDYLRFALRHRRDPSDSRRVEFNPLLDLGTLSQQFICEGLYEAQKLYAASNSIRKLTSTTAGAAAAALGSGSVDGIKKKTILARDYQKTMSYRARKFKDSVALFRKHGSPDLFITMTCNPNWAEFNDPHNPCLNAQNPAYVAAVFNAKVEELIREINSGLFGPVAAHVRSVEYQSRGLPHVHILVALKGDHKIVTPAQVDQVISAELPAVNEPARGVVVTHNMHTCRKQCVSKPCKFPCPVAGETVIDDDNCIPRFPRICLEV